MILLSLSCPQIFFVKSKESFTLKSVGGEMQRKMISSSFHTEEEMPLELYAVPSNPTQCCQSFPPAAAYSLGISGGAKFQSKHALTIKF